MKRYYLKKGDLSSNGGVVLEGLDFFIHHGTPVTFLGAKVYCSACDSTGVIVGHGPRRPDSIMGKHAALDGDRCACRCYPSPVMRASQDTASLDFTAAELAEMGFCPAGNPLAERRRASYDEQVRVVDRAGKPLSGVPYHIRTASGATYKGLTDSQGYCPRVYTDNLQQLDIAVGIHALERWAR
ncbi:PAAR domain-containing protein [Burkholderia ubonensis]|uniref:PAAR domain-containing protein n=1 Tax=Burkholderia ubonensis TaxID=101571 RepID=UPI002AB46EAB|nr:PAAR domain-containing protein [Burkholderia ubonensis]MDY7786968.1 PAAR domain-containing protein [Burkholderia ubonensis]